MKKSKTSLNKVSVISYIKHIFTLPTIVCIVLFSVIIFYSAFFDTSAIYWGDEYSLLSELFSEAINLKDGSPAFYILNSSHVGPQEFFFGVILAITQFGFLLNKRNCYTQLSFAINRKRLFFNKTFFPLLCASLVIISPKFCAAVLNAVFLGITPNLIKAFAVNALSSVMVLLFGYTITVIGHLFASRRAETYMLTLSLLCLPYAFRAVVNNIFTHTLYGYEVDLSFYGETENEITEFFYYLNPGYALFNSLSTNESIPLKESISFSREFSLAVIWIILFSVALLLCRKYFCEKFKAEDIGYKAKSKIFLMISCTTLPLLIVHHFCDFLNIFFEPKAIILITVSVILTAFFSIALSMLITLSPKKSLWGATGGGISALLHIIIVIIGVTGCFGFSTRIPDINDIESVNIYIPFGDMTYTHTNEFFYPFTYTDSAALKEESEIKIATDIHKAVISNREESTAVTFDAVYHLKNGKTIYRTFYHISEVAALEYTKIWETKDIKDKLKVLLNQAEATDVFKEKFNIDVNPSYSSDSYYDYEGDYFSTLDDIYPSIEPNTIHIISKDKRITDLSVISEPDSLPEFSKERVTEIMEALYKDACTLSAEQWYSPEKELGILGFYQYNNLNVSPEQFNYLRSYDAVFYINSNMKNTLSVLEKYNYTQYFECTKEVTQAHLVDINEVVEWLQYDLYPHSDYLHSTYFAQKNEGIDKYLSDGCGYMGRTFVYNSNLPEQEQLTDLSSVKDMVKNAYMAYNVGNNGKFLVVKFDDGTCSMLVIPE